MKDGKDFITLFRIIHGAIALGLLMFIIAAIVVVNIGVIEPVDVSVDRILQLVVVVAGLGMVIGGFKLFKKRMMAIRHADTAADEKISAYRAACITWWAMLDAAALLAVVSFILTANYAFLAVAIFLLLIIAVFMPKKENIILLLNLEQPFSTKGSSDSRSSFSSRSSSGSRSSTHGKR